MVGRLDSGLVGRRLLLIGASCPFWKAVLPASAAKGAAELDAEFYARSLLGIAPSKQPASVIPAERSVEGWAAASLIGATVSALAPSLGLGDEDLRRRAIARQPALAIEYDRALSSGAFGRGGYDIGSAGGGSTGRAGSPLELPARLAGSSPPAPVGQFALDLALFSLFTLLSEARVAPDKLATCYARLGDSLLQEFTAAVGSIEGEAVGRRLKQPADGIGGACAGMRRLLAALQTVGYIRKFSLDESDVDEELWRQRSELSSTRLSVAISDSAALRGALLLNANSAARQISPELVRPLLTAYLRASGVRVSEATEFFLDDEYRPNPLEYRPSQQVITLVLNPED